MSYHQQHDCTGQCAPEFNKGKALSRPAVPYVMARGGFWDARLKGEERNDENWALDQYRGDFKVEWLG